MPPAESWSFSTNQHAQRSDPLGRAGRFVVRQAGGQGFEPQLSDPESEVLPIKLSPIGHNKDYFSAGFGRVQIRGYVVETQSVSCLESGAVRIPVNESKATTRT